MIVTDKEISFEKKFIPYMDRMAERISRPSPKLDYALLIDGYEGYGKTNFSVGLAYYISHKTGRKFSVENIFFDPEEMVNFAITTQGQIIIWDEAAIAALAMQNANYVMVTIVKMLMMARKKRHFFIINIPRFYRLKEPIIERCMGLVHVYARHEVELGRFIFYKKKKLEAMYEEWQKKRRKPFYMKYKTLRGTFGEYLPKVIDEQAYDKKKDDAILKIADSFKDKKKDITKEKMKFLQQKISEFISKNGLAEQFCIHLQISRRTLQRWNEKQNHIDGKNIDFCKDAEFERRAPETDYVNKGMSKGENFLVGVEGEKIINSNDIVESVNCSK